MLCYFKQNAQLCKSPKSPQTPRSYSPALLYSRHITNDPKPNGKPKKERDRSRSNPYAFSLGYSTQQTNPPPPLTYNIITKVIKIITPPPNPIPQPLFIFMCTKPDFFLWPFMHGSFIAPGGGAGLRPGQVGASATPAAAGTGGDHGLAEPTGGHHTTLGELVTAQVGCREMETQRSSSSCRCT